MPDPNFATWLLEFAQTQGVAVLLIAFGLWFLDRRVWPLIKDTVVPAWIDQRKAQTELVARGVVALETIAASADRAQLYIHPPEQ